MEPRELDFDRDGAARFHGVFDAAALEQLARLAEGGRPGERLFHPELSEIAAPATAIAAALIGAAAAPVRAVLFDKTASANWALSWHQDRTILVRERRDVAGFGPWSRKAGALHVAPPVEVLASMVTLRIHLDACGPENAPLKVALRSHRLGLVPAPEAAARAADFPTLECLAAAGDVWACRTLILHASDRARAPTRRRVLQVDYAAEALPEGLTWRGVAA